MKILIRKARYEDRQELEKLFQVTRQKTFKSRSPDEFKIGDYKQSTEGEMVWVATKDGEIAGFMSVYMPNFIHNLFVYPRFQNQRIGTQLLQKAEETLQLPMELKIAMDNLKAFPFYEKHG